LKTILAGYDGTTAAEHASTRAELAHAFEAKVIVVSVSNPLPHAAPGAFGLMPYYHRTTETEQRIDEALLQQHRERVEAFFSVVQLSVEFAGVIGEPAEEIVEIAEAHDAS
jgi:nucleotide-binding universal stress UspA family protein